MRRIVLILPLAALIAGGALAWTRLHRNTRVDEIAQVSVGPVPLAIPKKLLRPTSDNDDTVGLALGWPDLGEPPPAAPVGESRHRVFLLLTPAEAGPDPATRTLDLYARFFEAESWSNPGGLVLRRFKGNSPYKDEELSFTPPDGRVFTARCARQGGTLDIGSETCLWLFRASGLDVQVRFPAELLGEWAALRERVTDRLASWAQASVKHAPVGG